MIVLLCESIRAFLKKEVYPLESRFLQKGFKSILPELIDLRQRVKAWGVWTPHLPKKYGGKGFSLVEFAKIGEEMGRTPLGHYIFNCQAPDIGNMELLIKYGTEEQKDKYLKPLIRGDIRSCFSMTEPAHAGSNPIWMSTTAVKQGHDYVINGHKWFTSAADGAAFAIVMAVTNETAKNSYLKCSQFLVPTNTEGFDLQRNIPIMGDVGEDYFSHSEIIYKNCRVTQANLIGEEGAGFALAQERLGWGRIHHCIRWVGICERVFEMMCSYAAQRQLSPHTLLANKQIIQHWIAECRADIQAARLMVFNAAEKIEQHGAHHAYEDISLVKFFVANVLKKVLDKAVQVHGSLGLTDDIVLSFWYRHERGAHIYDGPDEVHKSAVARRILKRFGVDINEE